MTREKANRHLVDAMRKHGISGIAKATKMLESSR